MHKDSLRNSISDQLAALDAISHLLTTSSFDVENLLQKIVRTTAELLRVKACAIRLLSRDTGEMVLKTVHGLSRDYLTTGPIITADSPFRKVIESGQAHQVPDVRNDPHLPYSPEALAEGIRSQLIVGLFQEGRAIGTLSVFTDHPHRFSEEEIRTFRIIANQAAAAVHLATLHQQQIQLHDVERELAIAADIQKNLMPSEPPRVEGVEMAASNTPSKSVGGDFYDFIDRTKSELGIVIGDVSGKGIPAALLMTSVCSTLRVQAETIDALDRVVAGVNRTLCRHTEMQQFATLFYGALDISRRVLHYVNAGHNLPLLFRGNHTLPLEPGGPPVGFFPDSDYPVKSLDIQSGDLLVLYTDGYIEAMDENEDFFGENRLQRTIREHQHLSPADLIRKIEKTVTAFESPNPEYSDDRTLVVLKLSA